MSHAPRAQDAGTANPLTRIARTPRPPRRETAGMRLRRRRFGTAIEFYAPGLKRWQTGEWTPERANRFMALSVTGTACALQCDHCQTKVLQGMPGVRLSPSEAMVSHKADLYHLASRLKTEGTEGILISGGSDKSGEVPLARHFADMKRVKDELGLKVIVHSGVVSPELAAGLAEAGVDGVMLDVIGADETIEQVYHLNLTAGDFERSLELLAERDMRIIPHIVLGLHYGRFLGEHNALEMIRRHPVSALVLVVLTPLTGTPMEHLEPPPVGEVVDFFAHARAAMPETPVNLGCGRPMGEMKVALDRAAIDHGLNGIAYPADGIVEYARASGLDPELYEYCCSLTWTD